MRARDWAVGLGLCSLMTLGACSAVDKFTDELRSWRVDTQETRDFLNKVAATATKAAEKAEELDRDKDGKVSLMEMLLGLGLLGGGGGSLLLARNGKSNERKTRLEARLDALERNGGAS